MGTKVTSSSGSVLEEPEIQKLQMQAKIFKENSLNKLNALKSTTQLLERQTFSGCLLYQQAFAQLFGDSVRTFKFQLSQHMNNLETLLNAETLHEMDSKSALVVIKYRDYTKMTAQTFKETIIQNMNSIEQCIIERSSHEQELKMTLKKLSERQLQIQQCKVQEIQSSVTGSGDETSSGIVSDEEIDKQGLNHNTWFTLGEHRKQKPFLKFNDLQCPTCKKCLYTANHDECVLEYLSKLNPRASAQNKDAKSHNTTKRYVPVEKTSESKKPERLIPKGHRFSHKKTTTVPEKTRTPRSCLRWQPTGRILKTVCLRWVPTGKLLNSCTGKVENEPTHGSNVDIPHIHACKQTLGLSAGTSFNGQKQQRIDLNADALYNAKQENLRVWLQKMLISKKPVPEWFHKR
ncbi:hypothetical protein Tco_0092156 [Tanacetum coccineum]